MKRLIQVYTYAYLVMFCIFFFFSCKPDEQTVDPDKETPSDTITVEDIDNLSDHLQFFNSSKNPGSIPVAPGSSSLKISFNDTLYLIAGVNIPVRFLHEDTTQNVAGAYIEVAIGSLHATYHYDVPKLAEVAESDTVSTIFVGFDPAELELPLIFEITITPHSKGGQPLDEIKVPVKIEALNDNPNKPGACGLATAPGEFWQWDMSMIPKENPLPEDHFSFYSDPYTVFGAGGQNIKGCCVNGASDSGATCLQADPKHERTLRFPTFYQIQAEQFNFLDDRTFIRNTFEKTANPAPDESNFCGGGPGVVKNRINHVTYNGNWNIQSITVPADLKAYYETRNHLTLQGTSSTGGGFGNPGGLLHQLTCKYMVLIQIDREGLGQHLYKFYERKSTASEDWSSM